MSEEELEDLLDIGCCKYHIEIGKKAKKEIERLHSIINDLYNGLEKIIEQGYDYNEKDKIAIKLISKIRELKGSDKE